MRPFSALLAASAVTLSLVGCNTTHRIETVSEVKPIHVTVDVNLKVDKELNNFFGDLDQQSTLIDYEEPAHSSIQ